jgi:pilus assembly protein Flp/PilA
LGHIISLTGRSDPSLTNSGVHMKIIKNMFSKNGMLGDNAGATAIEYGLIAALIAVAAIAAMQGLGGALSTTFNNIKTSEAKRK